MSNTRAAWTEAMDGFPDEWDGYCSGRDIEAPHPFRISALRVPLPRPKLGFDLSRRST